MMLEAIQVTAELEAYMNSLLPPRTGVLARLEREAEEQDIPAVGPAVGQLLRLLARAVGARRILELGTATGYSALWLLSASAESRLVGLEVDPERARAARANLEEMGMAGRAEIVEADAIAHLRSHPGPFDLIFNDLLNSLSGEQAVSDCFRLCMEELGPGGLLLADNALRRGQVVDPGTQQARNVRLWNRLVSEDGRLDSLIVPLRDGVSIALRK